MANTNADVLRVFTTDANLDTTIREKQIGFATDTYEMAVKLPGGTVKRYESKGAKPWTRDTSNGYIYPTTIADRVGIGINSPDGELHIRSADSTRTVDTDYDELIVEGGSANTGIQVLSNGFPVGIKLAAAASGDITEIYQDGGGGSFFIKQDGDTLVEATTSLFNLYADIYAIKDSAGNSLIGATTSSVTLSKNTTVAADLTVSGELTVSGVTNLSYVEIISTTSSQLKVGYNATDYISLSAADSGDATIVVNNGALDIQTQGGLGGTWAFSNNGDLSCPGDVTVSESLTVSGDTDLTQSSTSSPALTVNANTDAAGASPPIDCKVTTLSSLKWNRIVARDTSDTAAFIGVYKDGTYEAACVGGHTGNLLGWDDLFINSNLTSLGALQGATSKKIVAEGTFCVGTLDTDAKLNVLKTGEQLRLAYDASNYTALSVDGSGDIDITPSGGTATLSGSLSIETSFALSTEQEETPSASGNITPAKSRISIRPSSSGTFTLTLQAGSLANGTIITILNDNATYNDSMTIASETGNYTLNDEHAKQYIRDDGKWYEVD